MRTLLLVIGLISLTAFGQVKTTVQNGDFWALSTWDCFCFPQDGDSLILNHDITLSTGIAYTMGQIYISSSGTLDQGANNFSFYINGGSLINHGELTIDNLLLDSGFIDNHGTANLDSVWTRSTTNNYGMMSTAAFAHDEDATFTNSGTVNCVNNFANQGIILNSGIFTIGGNASNCNIQNSQATIDNDGHFCFAGTFLNCNNDTLKGDGIFYIGGNSTNNGEVLENLTINTPSGSFTWNTGNVASSVQYGTASCSANIEEEEYEEEEKDWLIFPNPATDMIQSSEMNVSYYIYDLSGKLVLNGFSFSGKIHIASLKEGNYLIRLENDMGQTSKKSFIKL